MPGETIIITCFHKNVWFAMVGDVINADIEEVKPSIKAMGRKTFITLQE